MTASQLVRLFGSDKTVFLVVLLQHCYVKYNELYRCYSVKGKEAEECMRIKKDMRWVTVHCVEGGGPACVRGLQWRSLLTMGAVSLRSWIRAQLLAQYHGI